MEAGLLVAIAGIILVVLITALAPRVGIASPLLLVLLGIGISFLPFVAAIEIEPDWILGGILPPLLYSTAVNTPTVEFRRDVRTISLFSVVLVVVSAVVIGAVLTWLIPGVNLALGIAVGAIVSPTDAVATSIVRKAGVSQRIVTILEGESLLNDASALVLLRSAIAATAASVSLWQVAGEFVYAVVLAIGIGFVVGKLNLLARARIRSISSNIAISLTIPFVAYLPAEHLGASGLVAAVAAGLVTGAGAPNKLQAEVRLAEGPVWKTIELLLESAVFLIMGLELFGLVEDVHADHASVLVALGLGAITATIVIAIRSGFVTWALWSLARRSRRLDGVRDRIDHLTERLNDPERTPLPDHPKASGAGPLAARFSGDQAKVMLRRRIADLDYLAEEHLGWREGVILVAAGMRGAVTLAAAQSLPIGTPHRSLLILIAFVVATGTLLLQGGLLRSIADFLGMTGRSATDDPQRFAALHDELARAAVARLDDPELASSNGQPFKPELLALTRKRLEHTRQQWNEDVDTTTPDQFADLRLILIQAQREKALRLRQIGSYPTGMLDAALRQLDADELQWQLRYD